MRRRPLLKAALAAAFRGAGALFRQLRRLFSNGSGGNGLAARFYTRLGGILQHTGEKRPNLAK